ncbi:MAG TPA: hypothetical protein VLK65_16985 [Vicinamibacteria bacterium]|nr:hypothetical protein [Vicinamibacteria bacterium]
MSNQELIGKSCAIQDAMGNESLKRTPLLTDFLLNLVEGRRQPYGTLTAHV